MSFIYRLLKEYGKLIELCVKNDISMESLFSCLGALYDNLCVDISLQLCSYQHHQLHLLAYFYILLFTTDQNKKVHFSCVPVLQSIE